MTMIGGSNGVRVQRRRARSNGWTKAKRAAFLDHLEATCNLTMSCAHVGMSYDGMCLLRRRDATFDTLVRAALEAGYERLEADLLARALAPAMDENPGEEDRRRFVVAMDDATKLRLLHYRHSRGSRGRLGATASRSDAEVTASLLKKLSMLAGDAVTTQ